MATTLGKAGYLLVSATTAVELRNYTLEQTTDTVEDTVIGDSWKTRKGTLNDFRLSAEMFWDPTDPAQAAAATAVSGGTSVTFALYPMGTATAATYYTGTAIITGLGATAAHDGLVERSFSCEGTGALSTAAV